jgi:hypothetical protein
MIIAIVGVPTRVRHRHRLLPFAEGRSQTGRPLMPMRRPLEGLADGGVMPILGAFLVENGNVLVSQAALVERMLRSTQPLIADGCGFPTFRQLTPMRRPLEGLAIGGAMPILGATLAGRGCVSALPPAHVNQPRQGMPPSSAVGATLPSQVDKLVEMKTVASDHAETYECTALRGTLAMLRSAPSRTRSQRSRRAHGWCTGVRSLASLTAGVS